MSPSIEFFRRLLTRGIILSIDGAGRLAFDAPSELMTPTMRDDIRAHRTELISILESIAERSAIMEHDGNMSREAADRMALEDIIGNSTQEVIEPMPRGASCPYCSSRDLIDDPKGCRCERCGAMAWVIVGGSIVRADCEKIDLEIEPVTHRIGLA